MSGPEAASLAGGFAIFFIAVLVAGLPTARNENYYVFAALFALLMSYAMPIVLARRHLGWFHPLVIVMLLDAPRLVRAFSGYAWGLTYHRALPEMSPRRLTELFALKTLLLACGVLTTYLGYALYRGKWAPRLPSRPGRNLPLRATAIVAVSALVAGAFIGRRGGVSAHLVDLGQGRHDALGGEHYLLMPAQFAFIAVALWLASSHRAAIKNPWFWVLSAAALGIKPLLTFSRATLVFDAATLALIYMVCERRVMYARALLGALLAVYVITVMGDLRRSTWSNRLQASESADEDVSTTISRGWSSVFVARAVSGDGTMAVLARVPERADFLYGESYLAVLAMPVPRSIWEDKPGLIGGRVGRMFFGMSGGVPPGSVGEAYWNFGYPGVFFVHLLYGIFLRIMGNLLTQNRGTAVALVMYSGLAALIMPVTTTLIRCIQFVGIVLFTGVVLLGFRRERSATRAPVSSRPVVPGGQPAAGELPVAR